MPLIHKRRIWWEGVPEATNYVVYVSREGEIFDPRNFAWEATPGVLFKTVTGKTDLIIPDEWSEFPTESGTYHIGITAKDDLGNESDPFVSSNHFKFKAPPPPAKAGVDSL
jgi:hypothetical protein